MNTHSFQGEDPVRGISGREIALLGLFALIAAVSGVVGYRQLDKLRVTHEKAGMGRSLEIVRLRSENDRLRMREQERVSIVTPTSKAENVSAAAESTTD